MKKIPQLLLGIPRDAIAAWWTRDEMRLAATLAFYTVVSLAPLLVLLLELAGALFGEVAARGRIVGQLTGIVGPSSAVAIQEVVASAHHDPRGPGLGSTLILILGAGAAFGELQVGLNYIWEVKVKAKGYVWPILRSRLLAFALVLSMGALLLLSVFLSTGLRAADHALEFRLRSAAQTGQAIDFLVSIAVVAFLFALLFRVLPDVRLRWADVIPGALVTSLLFALGRNLIAAYIAHADLASSYGAAGSLVAFLLFIYYSACILYFGAEYTRIYTQRFGSGVKTSVHAEPAAGASPTAPTEASAALAAGPLGAHPAPPPPPADRG